MAWPSRKSARAPRSIWRSSACCSMPAPDRLDRLSGERRNRQPVRRAGARKPRDVPHGAFSRWPSDPLRADAEMLQDFTEAKLVEGFQVAKTIRCSASPAAPRCCAGSARSSPRRRRCSAATTRRAPAGCSIIWRRWREQAPRGAGHPAEVLAHLGPIWPSRLTLGGVALGDCWRHPALKTGDATDGLVPLHKLSQWLAYSLIEPLQWAGIEVTDIDGLTGLAEYRNGGLFIDTGVLSLRDPGAAQREHTRRFRAGGGMARADGRAARPARRRRARQRLGHGPRSRCRSRECCRAAPGRPGATSRAKLRADGGPPLKIVSDGTVF